MLREMLTGAAAGALGTVALNVTTYLDMVVRARPASTMPARTAQRLAEQAGVDLAPESGDGHDETVSNRSEGLGALLGYATGLGMGTVYGALRSAVSVPKPLGSVLLGAGVMAGSDIPATRLGVTDPAQWTPKAWVSDIVPHLVYGAVTAAAYDALSQPAPPSTSAAVSGRQ